MVEKGEAFIKRTAAKEVAEASGRGRLSEREHLPGLVRSLWRDGQGRRLMLGKPNG